jgi:ribulose-phosphate 3-epimerase
VRSTRGLNFRVEIDGGVATDTVGDIVRAGVEILVAGNAVFGKGDPAENARRLLKAANEAALVKI